MNINLNNFVYEIPEQFKELNSIKSKIIISDYKTLVKINGYRLNIKNEQWEKGIFFKKIIPAKIKFKKKI